MKRILDFFWPLLGFAAVAVSLWLLHREFEGEADGSDFVQGKLAGGAREGGPPVMRILLADRRSRLWVGCGGDPNHTAVVGVPQHDGAGLGG